jgi:hypothetical protein
VGGGVSYQPAVREEFGDALAHGEVIGGTVGAEENEGIGVLVVGVQNLDLNRPDPALNLHRGWRLNLFDPALNLLGGLRGTPARKAKQPSQCIQQQSGGEHLRRASGIVMF